MSAPISPPVSDSLPAGTDAPLRVWQLFCFGLLSAPIAMGGLVLVTFIPTFYAVNLGLGLGAVGAVFVFGRLLDVITDPVIGHLSDQTRTNMGPRRPWMILGLPGFCLAVGLLFMPPDSATLGYLIVSSGLYFLFYTVLDVPYSSVGLEISPHIHERSVLASVKAVFQIIGAIAASFIPLIFLGAMDVSLRFTTYIIVGLALLGVGIFWVGVPQRGLSLTRPRIGLFKAVKAIGRSRPYRYMLVAFMVVQTANALTAGLSVLYISHIIQAPELIGLFMGLLFLSSALFLPLWIWISKRWKKKTAWFLSISIACGLLLASFTLGAGNIWPFALLCVGLGATFGCDAIMPTSMLADIVYQDEHEGGHRLGGLYLAVKNSVSKLTFIAPMGVAFPLLGFIGFNTGSETHPQKLLLLAILYAGLPIILRIVALFFVHKMPETETLRSPVNVG